MTKIQIEEFQKLEMAYLDSVVANDGTKQMQMMELIFFWLRKQIRSAQMAVVVLNGTGASAPINDVTEIQKQEFTFLQMAMIKAVSRDDRDTMVQVEVKMREWIDIQLANSVSAIIKPKIRIIRGDEK